jgi:hypothetical protein
MSNYRLEGLERAAEEVAQKLKKQGMMGCDLEVIGALLFIKYKGEDQRISKMLDEMSRVRKEAEELLEKLKNKTDE